MTNAISLKPINLKANLEGALKLLGNSLTHNLCSKNYAGPIFSSLQEFCFEIETSEMARLRELEEELKTMKQSYAKLQEVMKMKCRVTPVTVDVEMQSHFNDSMAIVHAYNICMYVLYMNINFISVTT